MNADEYFRAAHDSGDAPPPDPSEYCHSPIVVTKPDATLESVLSDLEVEGSRHDDRIIDREVILYWGENSKRIVTGPDLLGRLLNGIAGKTLTPTAP